MESSRSERKHENHTRLSSFKHLGALVARSARRKNVVNKQYLLAFDLYAGIERDCTVDCFGSLRLSELCQIVGKLYSVENVDKRKLEYTGQSPRNFLRLIIAALALTPWMHWRGHGQGRLRKLQGGTGASHVHRHKASQAAGGAIFERAHQPRYRAAIGISIRKPGKRRGSRRGHIPAPQST